MSDRRKLKGLYTEEASPIQMGLGERVFRKWIRPPDPRPPWKWAEENVYVDMTSAFSAGQKWQSINSPWVREVMECWADHRVTDMGIMCSAQSAKTQTLLCALPWSICEDPGPTLWVMASRDDVVEFAANRLMPTLERCKALRKLMPKDRSGKKQHAIHFDSMPFEIVGAGSPSKLQSKPIRYLILDEVRNYPPGALEMALKRTRTYWNCKRVIISTPDNDDDHVHRAYKKGDQRKWHFPCPKCQQLQVLDWKQMKWGDPADPGHTAFKKGPVWDYDALAPTIRYQCVACGHEIADSHFNRKQITNTGKWIRTNAAAPRHYVSFTWNAMLPTWVTWRSLVEEFLDAQAALRCGDHQPLKAFINESLGEPWEDRLKEFSDFSFLDGTKRPYKLGDAWAFEKVRFLSIDVQKDHYRFVCRAFGIEAGQLVSRLIEYGRVSTELEIDELRDRLNVTSRNVMMDSGHEAPRIYRMCARFGWKAFKGVDTPYFPAIDPVSEKRIRRLWSVTHGDPAMGTNMQGRVKPVKLFLTAKPGVQDMLAEWMLGMGMDWTLPDDVRDDYLKEVTASKRVERTDSKGHASFVWIQTKKDNHYEDCEHQIVVAALASGLVKFAARATGAPAPSTESMDGAESDAELAEA